MQKIINKVQMGRSFGHNNSLQKYVNKNIRNVMYFIPFRYTFGIGRTVEA